MFDNTINDLMANVQLRQMGAAKIKSFPANINIVTFILGEDFEVQYVYEMHKNETNYLDRVTPFPYHIGQPENAIALVDAIREDLELFGYTYEGGNFDKYMEINEKTFKIRRKIEKLFLSEKYADPELLDEISRQLDDVLDAIRDTKENMQEK